MPGVGTVNDCTLLPAFFHSLSVLHIVLPKISRTVKETLPGFVKLKFISNIPLPGLGDIPHSCSSFISPSPTFVQPATGANTPPMVVKSEWNDW